MAAPVEAKVKSATVGTFAVSLLIAALNALAGDDSLLDRLPAWLQVGVLAVAPPTVTFWSGWLARHTPRGPSGV